MKNFEKFEKEILEIARETGIDSIGLVKGVPVRCSDIEACSDCDFNGVGCNDEKTLIWLFADCEAQTIDWSKVPIDTKIVITFPNGGVMRRYFAGINEDGKPCYYLFGANSWTAKDEDSRPIRDDCTVEIVEE